MKSMFDLAGVFAAAIFLSGCATQHSGTAVGIAAGTEQGSASSAAVEDASFARQACQAAAGQVEIARLAAYNTKTREVRRFARELQKELTKADKELAKIFSNRGLAPESDYEDYMKNSFDRLVDLKGGEFDKAFKEEVIRSHERAIKLFEEQSNSGSDAGLKTFAETQLPQLRANLDAARNLPVSTDTTGPEPINEATKVINHPVTRSVQIGAR